MALYHTAKLEGNTSQEEHIQSLLDELDVYYNYIYMIIFNIYRVKLREERRMNITDLPKEVY